MYECHISPRAHHVSYVVSYDQKSAKMIYDDAFTAVNVASDTNLCIS